MGGRGSKLRTAIVSVRKLARGKEVENPGGKILNSEDA